MEAKIRPTFNSLNFDFNLKEGNLNTFAQEGAKITRKITSSEDRLGGVIEPKKIRNLDNKNKILSMIDHTLLKANATKKQIEKLCMEAKQYNFASVCVNPAWVEFSAKILENSPVKVCTVVGFPLGATYPQVKAYETKMAIEKGADEIDMVINIGALKSKDYKLVLEDIQAVKQAAGEKIVKVIIECCYLTLEEKITACILSKSAGADFVKTSTGFGTGGATIEDVYLMKKTVGDMLVKAAGGIRDLETAIKMVEAGADRLGTSSGVNIAKQLAGENVKIGGDAY